MLIKEVRACKIKDSRGDYTIEVSVNKARASSPSGKSRGKHETKPYKKSIDWNIKFLNTTKFDLEINSFSDLKKVESFIEKKAKIKDAKQFGADALFALESAVLKALAKSQKKQLWQIINPKAKCFPVPLGNAIGGGLHSKKFKVHPTIQEFLIIPGEKSAAKNVKVMQTVYKHLKKISKSKSVNDEGALQVPLSDEDILDILYMYIGVVRIGLDVAATSFYKKGSYCYKNKCLDRKAQIYYINHLIKKYKLLYVEDPLEEEDFSGFTKISKNTMVCGDDLTATHKNRLKKAIRNKSINAMIIKPNQNGSLVELKEIFEICRKHKIKTVLSHRSGETMDDALADYAFGFQADFIKTGISTKWRKVKLTRLIKIEKSLR